MLTVKPRLQKDKWSLYWKVTRMINKGYSNGACCLDKVKCQQHMKCEASAHGALYETRSSICVCSLQRKQV